MEAFSHGARSPITGLTQGLGAIFISRNFVSGASSINLRRTTMKSTYMNSRNVALLVAAGLLAGTGTAFADETPVPTASPTAKPQTDFQKARDAYKASLEAYIANRKSSMAQFKAAMETFNAAKKAFNDARKPIVETFKSELAAAKTVREAAIAAATTEEAKLAASAAYKAAVAIATSKRDAAISALGALPIAPKKPELGAKPTAPVKPTKAAKTS